MSAVGRFSSALVLAFAIALGPGMEPALAQGGIPELRLVPQNATFIGYADVRAVMASEASEQLSRALGTQDDGRREFEVQTGINIERDVDRVVACSIRPGAADAPGVSGLILARGSFDAGRIEALMRGRGAAVEVRRGLRLFVVERPAPAGSSASSPDTAEPVALTFIEPGLVAFGSADLVRRAIDRATDPAGPATSSAIVDLARSLEGAHVWAVGRFDELRGQAPLPPTIASQLPPITWVTLTGRVEGSVSGVVRAETGSEESAAGLRDAVRGLVALARLQAPQGAELRALLQSVEIHGTGRTVALSFDAPAQLFDVLGRRARDGALQSGR
jgi:hypothetical protein